METESRCVAVWGWEAEWGDGQRGQRFSFAGWGCGGGWVMVAHECECAFTQVSKPDPTAICYFVCVTALHSLISSGLSVLICKMVRQVSGPGVLVRIKWGEVGQNASSCHRPPVPQTLPFIPFSPRFCDWAVSSFWPEFSRARASVLFAPLSACAGHITLPPFTTCYVVAPSVTSASKHEPHGVCAHTHAASWVWCLFINPWRCWDWRRPCWGEPGVSGRQPGYRPLCPHLFFL